VPVKSADNRARQGMPDLDPTLEIGPSLNLFLLHSELKKTYLDLRLPVRPVIDINAKYLGYVFQPQLTWMCATQEETPAGTRPGGGANFCGPALSPALLRR